MKKSIKTLVSIGLIGIAAATMAAPNSTQVGRYMVEKNIPTESQSEVFNQTFSIQFPSSVQSIGDAMNYVLLNTGYQLVPYKYRTEDVQTLFNQKLPFSDRHMGPITVMVGLLTIAGPQYQLLIDPKHRYVSFMLRSDYKNLY